jgi:hypothetical protein
MTSGDLLLLAYLLLAPLAVGVLLGVIAAAVLTLRDLATGRTVDECCADWPSWLSSRRRSSPAATRRRSHRDSTP